MHRGSLPTSWSKAVHSPMRPFRDIDTAYRHGAVNSIEGPNQGHETLKNPACGFQRGPTQLPHIGDPPHLPHHAPHKDIGRTGTRPGSPMHSEKWPLYAGHSTASRVRPHTSPFAGPDALKRPLRSTRGGCVGSFVLALSTPKPSEIPPVGDLLGQGQSVKSGSCPAPSGPRLWRRRTAAGARTRHPGWPAPCR